MDRYEMNEGLGVRLATPDDAAAIVDISAPYILETTLTFVSTVPTIEQTRQKIEQILKLYPYLVCTSDEKVVGYAYAGEVRPHDAYKWNTELSIYLDAQYHRRGIATALYTALFQILRAQGYVNLYAVVAIPNDASIALHRHFGFNEIGVHERTGFKFGEWHDVVWLHHRIDAALDPQSHGLPTPIEELNKNDIDTALNLAIALLRGVSL